MAIFNQIPAAEIVKRFTYVGWMFGFVPVYIGFTNGLQGVPVVAVRNGWPEWLLSLGHCLDWVEKTIWCLMSPQYLPMYRLVITGEIRQGEKPKK